MKIDTFTRKIKEIIYDSDMSEKSKLSTIEYFLLVFCRQRDEYLKSKELVEPEALGTGSV